MIRYIHPWPNGPAQLYVEGNIVYAMNGRPVFVIEGQYLRQSPGGTDLFRISDQHIYKCGVIGNPEFRFG